MIEALTFDAAQRIGDGRAVRRIAFKKASSLPLSAVCLVANGVRERLGRLLGCELEAEAFEPAIVGDDASLAFEAAIVRRVRGRLCDVFVAIRRDDAQRLAAAAFGERQRSAAPLSGIELTTLERLLDALPPLCVPLCGDIRGVVAEDWQRAAGETATYFEVRLSGGADATLAFALTADPGEPVGATLSLDDVADVEVECIAECAVGVVGAGELAALQPGGILRLETPLDAPGTLLAGGITLLRGTCGMRDERAAFIVGRQARREAA